MQGYDNFTVGDLFRANASAVPNWPAVHIADRSYTFSDIDRLGNRYGHTLRGKGLGRGDRVCWLADTCIEAIGLYIAAAKLGVALAPLNTQLGPHELRPYLALFEPSLLLASGERMELGLEAAGPVGVPVARLDSGAAPTFSLDDAANDASDADVVEPELKESDLHIVMFTSGTTGDRPKGVMMSHRKSRIRVYGGYEIARTRPAPLGPVLCTYAQFVVGGWAIPVPTWLRQKPVVMLRDPKPETIMDAIQKYRATRLMTLPAIWERLLGADRRGWDLSSLAAAETSTTPATPDLHAKIRDAFPDITTSVLYGSSEGGSLILQHEDVLARPTSVGRPTFATQVRIGDGGEMQFRTPIMFDGYFRDEERTRAAVPDGWYHSGDTGEVDEEGFYWITGRLAEIIRTGGSWVSPWEVDQAIQSHPALSDAAGVGMPDPTYGEVICAAVVLKPGAAIDLAELRHYCEGQLASFKQPRRLEIFEELPRTASTGKLMRKSIAEMIGKRWQGG